MTAFVLIHGAFHGGWCWREVRRKLWEQGQEVFTPSLTGLGDRYHLMSPEINLDTHVQDIVALIEAEELTDVILCGHSYGGVVMAAAADRVPGRIKALIYLDALVIDSGQGACDVLPPMTVANITEAARKSGDGWKIPPAPASSYNVNVVDQAWVDRQSGPHPLSSLQQRANLSEGLSAIIDRTFIYATEWGETTSITPSFHRAKGRGWRIVEVPCGHDVMVDRPDVVVAQLMAAAARNRIASA